MRPEAAPEKGPVAKDSSPEAPTGNANKPRLHQLDGLRAVAITLVVFHHSATGAISSALNDRGFGRLGDLLFFTTGSGVELFFVLSGIVLLRPYLRDGRRFLASVYLRRRFERLWPTYAVALLFAGVVVYVARLHPTWYSRQVLPGFSGAEWLAQAGIINLGWPTYNGAWWSLNLEILFYVLVPLVVIVLLAGKPRPSRAVLLIGVAVAASLATALSSDYTDTYLRAATARGMTPWVNPNAIEVVQAFGIYAPCFALGVAIAQFRLTARLGTVLAVLGACYSLVALWQPLFNVHLGYAFIYAGVAIMAVEGSGRLVPWLAKPLMVWIGERSYSLFLVHFSVFYLVSYTLSLVLPNGGAVYFLASRLGGVTLAMLAAMTLFTFVERRFARGLVTADRFWPWNTSR